MLRWTAVADIGECPPGSACEVVLGDQVIALFNLDGQFHAIDGICAHQGGPLSAGNVDRGVVTCPWHGWQYDVRTGRHRTLGSVCQRRYNVRVDGSTILIGEAVESTTGDGA